MTINEKPIAKPIIAYALKLTNKAKKLDKGAGNYYGVGGLEILATGICQLFKRDATNYKMTAVINDAIRKEESKQKERILKDDIEINRTLGKHFYLASSHGDCAVDHKDYQGKFYVDEKYKKNYAEYIKKHNIQTVQWVTSKPIWFLTRPHCRHFFTAYTFEDVSAGKYKVPYTKVGDKKYQTPAKANLQYYEDRLSLLEKMRAKHPTLELERLILKTKILIDKWKKQV